MDKSLGKHKKYVKFLHERRSSTDNTAYLLSFRYAEFWSSQKL